MSDKDIKNENLGWSDTVVMICSKCGQESERIKSDLKSLCKERKGKDVRVINTGCLDICPENKIAVVVASNKDREVFHAYSVPVDVRAEELYGKLF